MACRDGLKNQVLKQYYSPVGGHLVVNLGAENRYENFTFFVCAQDPVNRFQYASVQLKIFA